jgi:hypothetical protein
MRFLGVKFWLRLAFTINDIHFQQEDWACRLSVVDFIWIMGWICYWALLILRVLWTDATVIETDKRTVFWVTFCWDRHWSCFTKSPSVEMDMETVLLSHLLLRQTWELFYWATFYWDRHGNCFTEPPSIETDMGTVLLSHFLLRRTWALFAEPFPGRDV